MKINDNNYDIETLVNKENPRSKLSTYIKNDIYLNQEDINTLKQYDFDINRYTSIKTLIFDIEDYINNNSDIDLDDLELVAVKLSEENYYQNFNK